MALGRDVTTICALQTGKICGLVTDTPSSMQKLWRSVEAAMPKVLAMGCWAHILNLFSSDVKKLPRIFEHIEVAKDIVDLFARQVVAQEWLRNQQGPNGKESTAR
ncbi:zinc finger bed domain-containing protein 1-like, partial [Haematococcus lacustris]